MRKAGAEITVKQQQTKQRELQYKENPWIWCWFLKFIKI